MDGDNHDDVVHQENSLNELQNQNMDNNDCDSKNCSGQIIDCENKQEINTKKLCLFEDIFKRKGEGIPYPDYSKKYLTKESSETEIAVSDTNNNSEQLITNQENIENNSDDNNKNNNANNLQKINQQEEESRQLFLFEDIFKRKINEAIFYPDYSNHYVIEVN